MLKIGVLGAGHLGKIHLKLIRQISDYNLVGFYDPDDAQASAVERELSVQRFADMDTLIAQVDVVDIVTPTLSHFACAAKAIGKSKHVFIEKPLASTRVPARVSLAGEHQRACGSQSRRLKVERLQGATLQQQGGA